MLSIIIPVYNGEKYIGRCLNSILKIDKSCSLEIIVVNDGSTDNTETICESFAARDCRISVHSIDNAGVSNARNFGLSKAQGEYIFFVDGDDEVLATGVSEAYCKFQNDPADIYIFDFYIANESGVVKSLSSLDLPINLTYRDIATRYIDYPVVGTLDSHKNYIGGKVFQYIIKRSILIDNSIKFENRIHYAEDMCFLFNAMIHAPKIIQLKLPIYKYYVIQGSASHRFRKNFFQEVMTVYRYICSLNSEIVNEDKLYTGLMNICLQYYANYMSMPQYGKIYREELLANEIEKRYISAKYDVKMGNRVLLIFRKYNFWIATYLYYRFKPRLERLVNKMKNIFFWGGG